MKKVINVYKPLGATPLQMVQNLRGQFPEYKNEKIGYAGRLDPLAHGVLLLMIGDATKDRDTYLHLEKEYEFEVLFGAKTDTYDLLGLSKIVNTKETIVKEKVNAFVNNHIGVLQQIYPPYSSKAVNGKPLFWWSRNNRLGEITLPTRKITIYSFALLSLGTITKKDLVKKIHETVSLVDGDFRQKEILDSWNKGLQATSIDSFQTATFRISCSSGTYVRGLVNELGNFLQCGAIALCIKRTKVGDYALEDSLSVPGK